jgi:dTDP-4-dehydrorhamnose reductase
LRILITGGLGRLASALRVHFGGSHDVRALSRSDLDVSVGDQVRDAIAAVRPDVIFNCAAYNDVDGAESDRVQAFRVNALACYHLAEAAEAAEATLVHFSSDFVFDGRANDPYSETDLPVPLSAYGESKLAGEHMARCTRRHYVLRLESVFGPAPFDAQRRPTSIDRMIDSMLAGTEVRALRDRTVSPSYTIHVAQALDQMLQKRVPYGLYHCTASDACTWYELAQHLAGAMGLEAHITPISVADLKTRAMRPQYCALSTRKLSTLGITMPSWRTCADDYLQAVRS